MTRFEWTVYRTSGGRRRDIVQGLAAVALIGALVWGAMLVF